MDDIVDEPNAVIVPQVMVRVGLIYPDADFHGFAVG